MSQIKKNLIYNVFYQILVLILPLITVPYISRVLGADGIGIYSYTYSIVYYFMLISMLGINNYGNRTVAKVRDNRNDLSKNFCAIYALQIIMTTIMIVCYFIYILLFLQDYKIIATIQMIYLFSTMFNINWLFFGLEKFKVTVTRSTILKILSVILVFAFVKNRNDVWIYALILSGSTLISQLLLFPFLKKEVNFVKIKFEDIKKHIKPCLVLFIPVIAVSLYKIMDKIMLGMFCNVSEVGLYEQAEKIINIPIGLVTALGTVMMPRISNLISKSDKDSITKYIQKSINFIMFVSFPVCFGLIAISKDFIPLFLGTEFNKSAILIYYLAPTILFISVSNVLQTQYMLPREKDKQIIIAVIIGAIVNVIINLILIPNYKSIGVSIGTLLAEFSVLFYECIVLRKSIKIINYIKNTEGFLIKSIIMFLLVLSLNLIFDNKIVKIIVQICFGTTIYFVLNVKYIIDITNLDGGLKFMNKAKKIIKRKYVRLTNLYYQKMNENKYQAKLKKWYLKNTNDNMDFNNPQNFNQYIQWLKLNDNCEYKKRLSDKYMMREYVSKNLGDKYLPDLYGVYDSFDEIDFSRLPDKFVLKCNHGSGMNYVIKNKSKMDLKQMKEDFNYWMSLNYAFVTGFELQYKDIERKIICEEYLGDNLVDFQLWCSNGKILFVSYINNPHGINEKITYDENWNKLDFVTSLPKISIEVKKPKKLEEMIKIAKNVSNNIKFVRLDFYILEDESIRISEFTFTPASGLMHWYPKNINYSLMENIKTDIGGDFVE